MARGGKIGYKRKRNKVRLEKEGSDESDEDYMVDEDEEFGGSEEDYCSSLAEDESEASLGRFDDEEEEEWVEKKIKTKKVKTKKAGRPRRGKAFRTRKKNIAVKPIKKKVSDSEEEEEDEDEDEDEEEEEEEYDDYCVSGVRQQKNKVLHEEEDDTEVFCREEDDDFVDENPRKRSRISKTEIYTDSYNEASKEKDDVSYSEEKEDDDYDESDDSDDEEFIPREVIKNTRMERVKRGGSRTKNRYNPSKKFTDENPVSRKRKTKTSKGEWGWGKSKKVTVDVNSESDFVSSESSDYSYTISEEEREQVREATNFCKRLGTNLKSSSSSKMAEEETLVPSKGKCPLPGRKGKQKVVDLNIEIGKQVCGVCLSEEGKKTVRGVLNCCSHYFCFACIMEWSKVESRCPLCKQRFATISRTARMGGVHELLDAVFPVPERDQVYQPSEEELRNYLDPYENFLCSECQQGGDDALMLLCDLCDSPAHTYCVGLGREVPDGNWYCDGCRPTALASSNAQGLNPIPDQGASNNLSVGSSPGSAGPPLFDLNEEYVPDTPLSQLNGHSQSPRNVIGYHRQPTSPAAFGSGAVTVEVRRRRQVMMNHLHFRNSISRQSDGSDGVASPSAIQLLGSQVIPHNINTPLYNRETFSPRLSNLREGSFQSQASTSHGHSFVELSQSEYAGVNARLEGGLGQQQLHPCSATPNALADARTSSFQFTEATVPSRASQGGYLHTRF